MTLYPENAELRGDSEMSLVEIYKAMRTCCYDVEPFEHLLELNRGVRLARKFQDPKSRGPLLLLTRAKAARLPEGTVLWNSLGEYQIIGAQKLRLGDEDYVWGVRPLKHEFDTQP
jgi:hypothetical protein